MKINIINHPYIENRKVFHGITVPAGNSISQQQLLNTVGFILKKDEFYIAFLKMRYEIKLHFKF